MAVDKDSADFGGEGVVVVVFWLDLERVKVRRGSRDALRDTVFCTRWRLRGLGGDGDLRIEDCRRLKSNVEAFLTGEDGSNRGGWAKENRELRFDVVPWRVALPVVGVPSCSGDD